MGKKLLCSVLVVSLTACASPQKSTENVPIADKGLPRLDQADAHELKKVLISALLRNPNPIERASFATKCYRDLAHELNARISAKISLKTVQSDVAAMAAARNQDALSKYPATKYWIRERIEGRTAAIAPGKDGLSNFDVLVDMPPNKGLRGGAISRPIDQYGPLVTSDTNDSYAFQHCYVAYDVPKLHLSVQVDPREQQAQIYAAAKANEPLKFTADVDVEYDFAGCRLSGCTPRIVQYELHNFKFGWDQR